MFDWGVGSSSSATAYVKKHFGDLFIDFTHQNAWGIDGIIVKSAKFDPNKVSLNLDNLPGQNRFILKARAVPEGEIEILINGSSIGLYTPVDVSFD